MDSQNLEAIMNVIITKVSELQQSLLINSLTNVANNPMYSEEARRTAVMRVENLLNLNRRQEFDESQDIAFR